MGMVNFLSMFCPELQKILKPIYDLTTKGNTLYGEMNNTLYGEKNNKMHLKKSRTDWLNHQLLHMPNSMDRFHLYSDTMVICKFGFTSN